MAELSFDPKETRLDASTTQSRIKEIVDTLFGHSEALDQHLIPALQANLNSRTRPLDSYHQFIDICAKEVQGWTYEQKGQFLHGHPEIGAPKVSGLSAKEQGTAQVDPKTLQRLQELNAQYRKTYPGLLYLTFVNGRSREAIVEELEAFLNNGSTEVKDPSSLEWKAECDRGVQAVIDISRDRLNKLGWDDRR